jgi:hypothetical protein
MSMFQLNRGLGNKTRWSTALRRGLLFTLLAGLGATGCIGDVHVVPDPSTGVAQLTITHHPNIQPADTVVLTVHRVDDGAKGDAVLQLVGGLTSSLYNGHTATFDTGEHLAQVNLYRAGILIGSGETPFFVDAKNKAASPEIVVLSIQISGILNNTNDDTGDVKEPATGVAQIAIQTNAGIQPTDTAVLTVYRIENDALGDEVLQLSDLASALYTPETETFDIGEYTASVDIFRAGNVVGTGELTFFVEAEDQAAAPEAVLIPVQISAILADPKDEMGDVKEPATGVAQIAIQTNAGIQPTDTAVLTVYRVENDALGDEALQLSGLANTLYTPETETFDIGEYTASVDIFRAGNVVGTGELTFFVEAKDQAASPKSVLIPVQISAILKDTKNEKDGAQKTPSGTSND